MHMQNSLLLHRSNSPGRTTLEPRFHFLSPNPVITGCCKRVNATAGATISAMVLTTKVSASSNQGREEQHAEV